MTVSIMKKMSMKALVGDVKGQFPADAKDGDTVWLGRVVGLGKGLKTGESNYGPWTAILGDFQISGYAGNGKDKTYRTGQLFLPEVVENMVAPEVANLERGASVIFAFDIGIIKDANSSTGYVYTAAFVKEPAENDPLALLTKEVAALPAPGTPEKEPAKK